MTLPVKNVFTVQYCNATQPRRNPSNTPRTKTSIFAVSLDPPSQPPPLVLGAAAHNPTSKKAAEIWDRVPDQPACANPPPDVQPMGPTETPFD